MRDGGGGRAPASVSALSWAESNSCFILSKANGLEKALLKPRFGSRFLLAVLCEEQSKSSSSSPFAGVLENVTQSKDALEDVVLKNPPPELTGFDVLKCCRNVFLLKYFKSLYLLLTKASMSSFFKALASSVCLDS